MNEAIKKVQTSIDGLMEKAIKWEFLIDKAGLITFAYLAIVITQWIFESIFGTYGFSWLFIFSEPAALLLTIIGLLVSFGKNNLKRVGVYFAIRAGFMGILSFQTLIHIYSFNAFVTYLQENMYMVIFGVFAFLAFFFGARITSAPAAPVSTAPVICKNCGKQLKPGASFCSACGTRG